MEWILVIILAPVLIPLINRAYKDFKETDIAKDIIDEYKSKN